MVKKIVTSIITIKSTENLALGRSCVHRILPVAIP